MDIKTFIGKVNLTPKEKAVFEYLNTVESVGNTKLETFSISHFEENEVLSRDEYIKIMKFDNDRDAFEYFKWTNILSILLNFDAIAQKYYYQTTYLISFSLLEQRLEKNIDNIKNLCFHYLIHSFSTSLMNYIFDNFLEPDSLKLLKILPLFENDIIYGENRIMEKNYDPFLTNIYRERKNEIIKIAKSALDEIVSSVREYEYISESTIERYIDKTDQFFQTSLFPRLTLDSSPIPLV